MTVNGATQWGDDISAIGTFLRDPQRDLYNLYVVDPSEQQIRAYPPASDGGGFPAKPTGWLATARAVDQMSSMYIDGDMFITEGGVLERFTRGKSDGWEPGSPEDDLLRPASDLVLVAGSGDQRAGLVYALRPARTTASSPSTSRAATMRPSTASPAAGRTGTTCAACTSSRASARRPRPLVWLGAGQHRPGRPRGRDRRQRRRQRHATPDAERRAEREGQRETDQEALTRDAPR